jgi:flavin reductase (DIM6/NTAB) family NADH-FMN oxidoreductase RutF
VPDFKQRMGFSHMPDKFEVGGFTPAPSDLVRPPRIAECPIQIEAERTGVYGTEDAAAGPRLIIEVRSLRVHARSDVVPAGTDHIDPAGWRPLLYVFRSYFGTGPELGRNFRAGT